MTAKTGPSQSMVERVTAAIYGAVPAEAISFTPGEYENMGRAAIEAMRTPTEAMLQAVYARHTGDNFWDESTVPPTLSRRLLVDGPSEDLNTMIDAALSEGK